MLPRAPTTAMSIIAESSQPVTNTKSMSTDSIGSIQSISNPNTGPGLAGLSPVPGIGGKAINQTFRALISGHKQAF